LGNREIKNILNLKIDKILNKEPNAILEALFLREERFTNPFFIPLDSLNSTAAKLLGS